MPRDMKSSKIAPHFRKMGRVVDLIVWKVWGESLGIAIAAITGVVNLFVIWRRRRNRIFVGCETITPHIYRERALHVINKSDHCVKIRDYGFIDSNRTLVSIPLLEDDPGDYEEPGFLRGSTELPAYNASYECGVDVSFDVIGVYAAVAGGGRPTLAFNSNASFFDRFRVRLRLIWRPNYFRWGLAR